MFMLSLTCVLSLYGYKGQ